jgi:hypothetical protein
MHLFDLLRQNRACHAKHLNQVQKGKTEIKPLKPDPKMQRLPNLKLPSAKNLVFNQFGGWHHFSYIW